VLAFYGGQDRNVPGRQSADELRAMLASAGNTDVTIHFAPDADHWLWRVPESGRSAERRAKVEGLGAGIADWLVAHAHPSSSDCSPQDSQR
jgi:hypothetical protein